MDQEGGVVRRMPIGALQPGTNTAMVVALIISKSDPRKIIMKKDGSERWVTTFTLRDSPSDMINMTIWSGKEEAISLKNFHTGDVVEVVKPRIIQRDLTGKDNNFNPTVTSSSDICLFFFLYFFSSGDEQKAHKSKSGDRNEHGIRR